MAANPAVPPVVALAFHAEIMEKRRSEHSQLFIGTLLSDASYIRATRTDQQYPILEGGDSDKDITIKTPDGTFLVMDNDAMTLRTVDGKVLFSTTVRDQAGNTVVQVKDNHCFVAKEQQQSWDHNYDDHALEVLDGRHMVVLQVRMYQDGARVQGEWFKDRQFIESGKRDPVTGIIPLFKYPQRIALG